MSEAFERFWASYPKKQGKKAVHDKWVAKKLDAKVDIIVNHVEARAKRDKQWLAGYIPMPTTFINQERWCDEYETVAPKYDREKPSAPTDPLDLNEGVKGSARACNLDHTGLTENEVWRLVWAKKYGGIHLEQLSQKLHDRLSATPQPDF